MPKKKQVSDFYKRRARARAPKKSTTPTKFVDSGDEAPSLPPAFSKTPTKRKKTHHHEVDTDAAAAVAAAPPAARPAAPAATEDEEGDADEDDWGYTIIHKEDLLRGAKKGEFEVERVHAHRITDQGVLLFHVEFAGFPKRKDWSWIPTKNFALGNPVLMAYVRSSADSSAIKEIRAWQDYVQKSRRAVRFE